MISQKKGEIMATYYYFYNPRNMEEIASGKFVGLYDVLENNDYLKQYTIDKYEPYNCFCPQEVIGILDRDTAKNLQKHMTDNKTLFTDLMDEKEIECLIYKIE